MSVYVDEVTDWGEMVQGQARNFGTKWSHMTADTPEELHAMAQRIGLRREWCSDHTQPGSDLHYDLTPGKRAAALRAGALPIKLWTTDEPEEQRRKARQKASQQTLFPDNELPD